MSEARSDLENFAIGMVCAPIFAVALQPTIYLKHARMQAMPLTMSPKVLWRGTMASVYNETGQASLQFLTTGFFKRCATSSRGRPLTAVEDASAAAAGGAVTALWASPVELVMIKQQRAGGSMIQACSQIYRNFGMYGFARGYLATGSRDSLYTIGMFSATPFIEAEVKRFGFGTAAGTAVSSLTVGVIAGTLSCPLDCIKACMKGDIEQKKYKSFLDTGRVLLRTGGVARLFHGVEWRCANLFGSFFVVSAFTSLLDQYCPAGGDVGIVDVLGEVISANLAKA